MLDSLLLSPYCSKRAIIGQPNKTKPKVVQFWDHVLRVAWAGRETL